MAQSKETLMKKYEGVAKRFEEKGRREWAYAKNDLGDEHYGKARKAFNTAKECREKANEIRNEL